MPLVRPDHLPDFTNPPIVEVALSIQFAPPSGYREVFAREVWAIFENAFPDVEEMPPIQPSFEVFGGPEMPGVKINFGILSGPMRNRYWFLTPDKTELIQFQQDRFIHNWRKVINKNNEYPRFEAVIEKFSDEARSLDSYFLDKGWGPITPTQCEITYVNQMSLLDENGQERPRSFYFRSVDLSNGGDINDFSISIRKTIPSDSGTQIGRLYIESSTTVDGEGKPIIGLNLTARGAPVEPTLDKAIAFLFVARELIVTSFAKFTSDEAHALWDRKQ
jgi:uncharacterized protein (TIGR04255 family)